MGKEERKKGKTFEERKAFAIARDKAKFEKECQTSKPHVQVGTLGRKTPPAFLGAIMIAAAMGGLNNKQ